MTWRFQRRIGIAPGLRLNVSKSGVSASVGERGAHLTIGRVPRITVGLPGSGLSWTQTLPRGRSRGGRASPIIQALAVLLDLEIGLAILAMIASSGG
jgi:Protein of unknown function (DUF4236)